MLVASGKSRRSEDMIDLEVLEANKQLIDQVSATLQRIVISPVSSCCPLRVLQLLCLRVRFFLSGQDMLQVGVFLRWQHVSTNLTWCSRPLTEVPWVSPLQPATLC